MNPENAPARTGDRLVSYRWPLAVLGVAMMALLAFMFFLWWTQKTLEQSGKAGHFAAQKAEVIAEKFLSGNITKTFVAAIPEITSTGTGNLELAASEQVETFRAEDEKSILWDKIYLGKTISEIRAPVTYRYHLRLADPWRLDVSGQTCLVLAPMIRPSLPPAIHTDRLEKKSDAGWGRFNAAEQMAELERSVTPTLSRYAADERHLALVREPCRQTVAEFVKTWLLKEDHWRTDRFHTIKVIFADETAADPQQVPPTIELK
jgi:hypothetical protein